MKTTLKSIRRLMAAAALSALGLCLLESMAAAATPQKILYQGTLRRSGSIYTGNATFVFRITDATGATQYWTSGSTVVAVSGGLFRYPLGVTNTGADGGFPSIDWANIEPYVEVTVDGSVLLPREAMTAVPYALYNSGITDNTKVLKAGDAMTGPLTMASGSTITVTGSAFSVGGSTFVVAGGNVGVGAASPAAKLDVAGSAQFGAGALKSTFTATPGTSAYALQLS